MLWIYFYFLRLYAMRLNVWWMVFGGRAVVQEAKVFSGWDGIIFVLKMSKGEGWMLLQKRGANVGYKYCNRERHHQMSCLATYSRHHALNHPRKCEPRAGTCQEGKEGERVHLGVGFLNARRSNKCTEVEPLFSAKSIALFYLLYMCFTTN